KELITSLFAALGRGPNIEYIDMPPAIRNSYQYFTQASTDNLRQAGYSAPFTPVAAAVTTYVTRYLDAPDRYR
ncbi:MAG: ADP-glyceromanno-heptose 6-epimerase, partial [Xanthobacteraceae bacterium]|nr:ADP-glyceromanno-heptose 6-epimerase [Xanthobacteraceae bacterium]